MRNWSWSKVEVQSGTGGMITPCAGHSLVSVDSMGIPILGELFDSRDHIDYIHMLSTVS